MKAHDACLQLNWLFVVSGLAGALLALLAVSANAFPQIYDAWDAAYPEASGDDMLIATVGTPCQVCHVNPGGGSPWNQYGFAVLSNGGFANIPAAFLDIEQEDADGEGSSNIAEIDAGALPGWCEPTSPGCENLAWTRDGVSSPATPPDSVTLDPPPGPVPPVADAGGPYAGIAGTRMRFDATASSDADGEIVVWHWKFGDGTTATGPTPVHAYADAGEYTVWLAVQDTDGLWAMATASATVVPVQVEQPPVANPGGPYGGTAGVPVAFDGSQSFDLDGLLTSWQWTFGDGASATGESVNHTYAAPGEYKVTLTVTDDSGLEDSAATSAAIAEAVSEGEAIFRSVCQACHGDPWDGPAVDPGLVAGRRNTGARLCSIQGAINGNAVFPNGVPEMQFLQGVYTTAQLQAVSDFLNSQLPVEAQRRFVTTCAGCHGNDASGGRVNEDIRGRDLERILRALSREPEMAYLDCLPIAPDLSQIGAWLSTLDDD
ncbi:MAG: PKD domain-containing protein [Pseudomonadota bacterium]